MKRIFSILFAVVLVISFSLIAAAPVAANGTVTNIDTQETFVTIQAAIDDVDTLDGHTIEVGAGDWDGALVTKSVEIRGEDGAKIVGGPTYSGSLKFGFRLVSGSDGATISHFTFDNVCLPVYSNHGVDDVTIEHNRIYVTMQGITNWDGDGWVIRQNVIEGIYALWGGGIGIAFGSRGDDVSGNLVTHNKIVAEIPDDRAFSVGGILLCTDERKVPPGIVSNNKIVHNKVKITGESSWAISLQLIPPIGTDPIGTLRANIVGFNDLRGSDDCIGYYPDAATLEPINTISRNLGEDANRGHGAVPANIFRPM